jgi:hypothetical protein
MIPKDFVKRCKEVLYMKFDQNWPLISTFSNRYLVLSEFLVIIGRCQRLLEQQRSTKADRADGNAES